MKIFYSSKFERGYRKLPQRMKIKAEEKEKLFRSDPFHPVLDTHKLGGRFQGFWAFSIDNRYRIIFEFMKNGIVWFHLVGDHSIYQ